MRKFETGATRDDDTTKHDYEGFLNPRVIYEYGCYMHKHRIQSDGRLRDSDNWQKGIPKAQYVKSLWRHFLDLWSLHRGMDVIDYDGKPLDIKECCCAIMFNVMGILCVVTKEEEE